MLNKILKSIILVLVFLMVTNANVKSQCSNPPMPTINPQGPTTFCAGGNVSLDAGLYASWLWSNGATNQSIIVSTGGDYFVTVTDTNGCTGTSAITVTINPLPTVSFTLASSYNYNDVIALTGSPTGGVFSGTGVSANVFTAAMAGVGGPYSITYTYTNINGCSNNISHSTNVLAAYSGPSSSASPYVLPVAPGVSTTSILSAPNVIGSYEMEGIPDGLGAFDNNDGTFTLLANHEITNTGGVVRAHGSIGAFVSKWVIDKATLTVLSGSDLIQNVNLWNTSSSTYTTYNSGNPSSLAKFGRFCAADLPAVSAFYNVSTAMGTQERIFMNGEETNDESRAMAHIVTGPNGGTSWELPALGKAAWENAVACPVTSNKTIVGLDNDGTDGQVYFYIGTKTNTGNEITKAGLTNGHPWGVKVTGFPVERVNSTTINNPPAPGTHFDLVDLGDVRNITGATFNANSNTASVTKFSRPEDGCWDPSHPGDYYFNTTDQIDQVNDGVGAQVGRTRVWRLRFTDIYNPELGGTIEAVLDGTEGLNMLDNMVIDHYGHLLLQEDVGNQQHNGKIWQYTITTDALVQIAKHDPARFGDIGILATSPFNQDEETSGIIDMQEILGAGYFLSSDQAHYPISGAAFEGGQFFQLFNPDTYNASLCATTSSTSITACGSYSWNNYTYTSSGTYTYHTTNSNGCDSAATLILTINPIPAQPSSFTVSSAYISPNQTGVVYTVPSVPNATSYNWIYSGSGATIVGSGNSVTINFSGSATAGMLSVTATNSCGTSTALTLGISVNPPSFGTGNLVILQTNTTVSKSSSPITLKEITPTGAAGITVAIPSSSTNNYPFQTSGIYGGSEGFLSTSTDNKLLMLGGYATSATIADITATTAALVSRAVGTVNQSGFFSQVATSNTFYNANDIRGAVSDGTNYWTSGASTANVDGIDYFGPGTQEGLATGATPPKAYGLRIFNGNIYYSTQKAGPNNLVSNLGIFQLGTGLPTSGTQTVSQVIGTGATVLPQDFSFNAAGDVCYIASGLLTANGGVRKYTKSAGVWTYQYTLGTAAQGAYGLVVDYSGANPIVYATTLEAGGNKVIKITDTGAGSAVTVLVPVVTNVYNKGISFAPVDAGTPTVNLNISTNSGSEAGATVVTVTAIASSPVSGNQTISLNVTGTGITAGDYTLSNTTITIPSGATTGTVTFTVVDDVILETTETATLSISSPTSGIVLGATTSQTITIADNDNTAPTISMNVATTSDLVDGGVASSPASPYTFSGTIADVTDPASTLGFDFVVNDAETAASGLTVTATSSNVAIVPNANLILSGTGAIRNLKITPIAAGYSNITVSVSDGVNTTSYIIAYAASVRTPDIAPVNTFWHTGISDASDGIAIDDNYYMTGDDEFSYVNVYSRTESGAPAVVFDAGAYCALPDPGHPEIDIEGATRSTTNPNKMYWAGSMSNGASPFPAKPNRDRIFATTITGTGNSTVITFAGWAAAKTALLAWGDAHGYSFTASATVGVDSKSASGFALEGMTFGPDNSTLYLGLRAPLVPTSTRTNAVIAPLLNFEAWFNNGSPVGNPTFGSPIELNLNMRGIREIQRLTNGTYVIIAGDPGEGLPSDLYKWTGYSIDAPVLVTSAASGVLKMEGLMQVNSGATIDLTKLQVITDGGDVVLYNDGNAAKDLGSPLRKFRSDILTGLDLNICTGFAATITPSGSTNFCSGGSVSLNVTAGNNNNSYLWSNNATTQSITSVATGNYSVTVTNNTSGCVANASQSVTVNPLPTATANNVSGCAGSAIALSGSPAGGTFSVANPYTGPSTTYTYSYTDGNGCSNTSSAANITVNPIPAQPAAFTTKTTFVYKGDNGVAYTVPNQGGVTYGWTYSGSGATINGSSNAVIIDYSSNATSGTLSVTASSNGCTSTARTLAIVLNNPIIVPTSNFDYSFVTVGCNRVDYLDTAITTGDPDYATGKSTANVYQLKRLFTEISHLNPLPKFLIMTGDIVMGYKTPSTPDTIELAKQLNAWRAIYENHPLSSMGITLIAIPGNHETQDKAAGKHSFAAAEQIFTRIMAPYILGSNGPGIGGPDNLTTDQSKLTYSFNYGGDHYIMIDTDPVGKDNETPYKWIATDIQNARANHARHIFTFGHKPAYSSPLTPAGGLDAATTLASRDSLWKYLENNNCEAMFSAHEHLWDTINPHTGKTWQVINGNGGTRVEPVWVGSGRQYYGYTIVNLYNNRTVNVMGVGRNTTMSTTVGVPYTINEDSFPSTVRNNFNICLTTTSSTSATACNSYTWNNTTYTSSGTYSYITPNAAGCDSIATLHLTINPLPNVTAANVGGCTGSSIALSGSPAGGTFSISSPYTGPSTTYTYSYTNGNGCSNTSTAATITVSQQITNLTITGPTSVCAGGNATLTTGAAYGAYLWSTGATTQSINVSTTGTYYVTVTNGGCCTAVAQKSVTVTVAPIPAILASNLSNLCGGGNANLNVGATFPAYAWSTGATTQGIVINTGGNYIVTVTNTNGCTGTSSQLVSSSCNLPTFPATATTNIAATTAMGNWIQPTCYYGYSVRISKLGQNNWTTYTIIPNSHYTFSQLTHNTTYEWQIRTNCNASGTINSGYSSSQIFTTLARMVNVEAENNISSFNAYPNPAKDLLTISFSADKKDVYYIRLMDATGRLVYSNNYSASIGENQYQLHLSDLSNGIYLMELQNGSSIVQKKIVIE